MRERLERLMDEARFAEVAYRNAVRTYMGKLIEKAELTGSVRNKKDNRTGCLFVEPTSTAFSDIVFRPHTKSGRLSTAKHKAMRIVTPSMCTEYTEARLVERLCNRFTPADD